MGTLTGTKFEGNTTGSVSAISDDTNLNLGTLTASQFIGNTPGNAAGISAAKNIAGGTITATTFYGNGAALTGAGSTAYIRQTVTASSSGAINLNLGNIVYFVHDANATISFSNVGTVESVTIIRTISDNTLSWPGAVKWNGGSAPTLATKSADDDVFTLLTRDEGVTWYGWEDVAIVKVADKLVTWGNSNTDGQLGLGNVTNPGVKQEIFGGGDWSGVQLSNRGGQSSRMDGAIKSDGTLW